MKWGITAAIFAFVVSVLLGIVFEVAVIHIFARAMIFTAVFFGLGFGLRLVVNNYFPEILSGDEAGYEAYTHSQDDQDQDHSSAGIILDNTGEYAVPELYKTPSDPEEMGNIEDLISGVFNLHGDAHSKGVDANVEPGYNSQGGDFSLGLPEEVPFMEDDNQAGYQEGGFQDDSGNAAPQERQVFTPSFGDEGDGMGGLPDLDMMARAFSFGGGGAPAQGPAAATAAPSAAAFVSTTVGESFSTQEAPTSTYKGNKPEPMKGDFNPKELAEGIRSVLSKDK